MQTSCDICKLPFILGLFPPNFPSTQAKEGGGTAVYQGGFDAVGKLDQEYAAQEKERKIQAFNDQQRKEHQNVKKEELAPKAQNVIGKVIVSRSCSFASIRCLLEVLN